MTDTNSASPCYVLALDQGTTSTRAILFDTSDATVAASHQREHRQYFPQPGWIEHDAEEILEQARECIRVVCDKACEAGISVESVKAVGIANQRETTVVWDRESGRPLHRALVWSDIRTRETCRALMAEVDGAEDHKRRRTGRTAAAAKGADRHDHPADRFRERTGLPISTYFSGVKLKWLMDHDPSVRDAILSGSALFGTVDSWLLYRLTEQRAHVTDVTNASRTLLMDLQRQRWDAQLLQAFGIPESCLPRICSSAEVYGTLSGTGCAWDGRLPIAGVLGDQHAAMVGQACLHVGTAKCTYGTGCFLMVHTGERAVPSAHGLLTTAAFRLGACAPMHYALEGSVAVAGAGVQWLADHLQIVGSVKEAEQVAASVPDTGDVYLVPAFSGLFAPRWRSDARGTIVGMTQFTRRAHLVRAMLEQVCFQTTEVLRAAESDLQQAGLALEHDALRVDGGMAANNLLMQIQADLLGMPVVRPRVGEATALGAAAAAAIGAGVFTDMEAVRALWQQEREFTPQIGATERQARHRRWSQAVERSLGWAVEDGDEDEK
ncbi:hypothetical protein CDCA_CDCA08G2552 [Cyanidium caldarium]|uniref:Probable glycerol kinase n=1 Tax=Cyanidium caldarium TaxID=2771 RepID=A0AAV9IW89_CYACA|nr:hypothetical protein CDCA_CDCA08G2552 [Cyanidium caldarium]